MSRKLILKLTLTASLSLLALFFAACSKSSSGTFGCTASGVIASGDQTQANVTLSITSLSVQILNPGSGPFTISVGGGAAVSSTTPSYVYPSAVSIVTGASGGITTSVSVTDASNSANVASCVITASSASATGTTGGLLITALPGVTAYTGSYGVTVAASLAGLANGVYTMSLASTPAGVVFTQFANGIALITSSVANTVTVNISVSSAGAVVATGTETITFAAGTPVTSLQCQLFHTGGPAENDYTFNIATNTGEALEIVAWDPGETWSSEPTYPLYPSVALAYSTAGTKRVSMLAKSVSSGIPCNENGLVTDQVSIY